MFPSYSPLFTLGLLAEPCPSDSTVLRNGLERHSFLYLDLADRTCRPPSQRRKLSKSTSWTCTADVTSVYDLTRPMNFMSPAPTRRRTSKESLRSIPCPKPVPSATLPNIPFSPSFPSAATPAKRRPASTVTSSLHITPHMRRPASMRSESISPHDRRKIRMDALACLEGRTCPPNCVLRPSTLCNNFMSLGNDADDTTRRSSVPNASIMPMVHIDDLSLFADVEDEADAIIPSLQRKTGTLVKSRPPRCARNRRSTIDSWFPLKSFIDFKDDDLSSWNWRSFIEFGGVS